MSKHTPLFGADFLDFFSDLQCNFEAVGWLYKKYFDLCRVFWLAPWFGAQRLFNPYEIDSQNKACLHLISQNALNRWISFCNALTSSEQNKLNIILTQEEPCSYGDLNAQLIHLFHQNNHMHIADRPIFSWEFDGAKYPSQWLDFGDPFVSYILVNNFMWAINARNMTGQPVIFELCNEIEHADNSIMRGRMNTYLLAALERIKPNLMPTIVSGFSDYLAFQKQFKVVHGINTENWRDTCIPTLLARNELFAVSLDGSDAKKDIFGMYKFVTEEFGENCIAFFVMFDVFISKFNWIVSDVNTWKNAEFGGVKLLDELDKVKDYIEVRKTS